MFRPRINMYRIHHYEAEGLNQAQVTSLREVHVVFFTTCGNICGVFHHKSKIPQILVVFFTTSPDHHKYLW